MGGSSSNRTGMLTGAALVAALFGVSFAAAQEVLGPAPAAADGQVAVDQIDLSDPQAALRRASVSMRSDTTERFAPSGANTQDVQDPRSVELEFAAGDGDLDVSFAQRASIASGRDGDIDRQGRGSEVRIGRNLVQEREGSSQTPSTYVFVASDNEALTWQPGQRSEFGGSGSSFSLQDRVEVGDMAVGVTYEQHGIQASLAYVEREESTTIGQQTFNQDESFTGLTVTMRR